MNAKELLCIALMAENGQRFHAEVYTDGTVRKEDGEVFKLPSLQLENVKVLTRRANREKMLAVAANDVLPFRDGDAAPKPYMENIAPLTENDFLLPEERKLSIDTILGEITVDAECRKPKMENVAIADMQRAAERLEHPKEELPKSEPENQTATVAQDEKKNLYDENKPKSDSQEMAPVEDVSENDIKKQATASANPKRLLILAIIALGLLLCCVGFGFGYVTGYMDLPGSIASTVQNWRPSEDGGAESMATPEPTVAPTPPKTEINLTINAMDGAEVTGSTNVGANEESEENVSSSTAGKTAEASASSNSETEGVEQ